MASRDPERERQWHTVLTQWHQSDQTISAFCKLRNLSKPTFGYWQRKLGFSRRTKPRSPAAKFVPMILGGLDPANARQRRRYKMPA